MKKNNTVKSVFLISYKKGVKFGGAKIYSDQMYSLVNENFVSAKKMHINETPSFFNYPLSFLLSKPFMWLNFNHFFEIKNNYDLIIFDHFRSASSLLLSKSIGKKIILISHNLESQNYFSLYKNSKSIFKKIAFLHQFYLTRYWESKVFKACDLIFSINELETKIIRKINPNTFTIFPQSKPKSVLNLNLKSKNILIVGSFRYIAKRINLFYLIKEVFPFLSTKGYRLIIAGSGLDSTLKNKIKKLNNQVTIYSNPTNEKLDLLYNSSHASIVPEKSGGGFKLKIIEALSHAVPIVAQKEALKGTGLTNNYDCLSVDSADDYLNAIIKLENIDFRRNIIENGFSSILNIYSSNTAKKTFKDAIKTL